MNRRKFLTAIGLAPIAATVPVAAKAAAVTGEFCPEAMMPLYDRSLAASSMRAEEALDVAIANDIPAVLETFSDDLPDIIAPIQSFLDKNHGIASKRLHGRILKLKLEDGVILTVYMDANDFAPVLAEYRAKGRAFSRKYGVDTFQWQPKA